MSWQGKCKTCVQTDPLRTEDFHGGNSYWLLKAAAVNPQWLPAMPQTTHRQHKEPLAVVRRMNV